MGGFDINGFKNAFLSKIQSIAAQEGDNKQIDRTNEVVEAGQVVEIVPAQNTTQISVPIEVMGNKIALGISSDVSGAGDVERVVSLSYSNFCALDLKRYDTVTVEGNADYWGTPLSVRIGEGALTINTGKDSVFFGAGEKYTIYIIVGDK